MTTFLPPFTGDRTRCTKCGHDEARTTYRRRLDPGEQIRHEMLGVDVQDREQERLCRECLRCHHHWDEAIATNDDAAPFRRLPLGQQFTLDFVHHYSGETHLILRHTPSGLSHTISYPRPASAAAAEQPLLMFQALLDQVDDWGRQPIDGCSVPAGGTVPNNQESS